MKLAEIRHEHGVPKDETEGNTCVPWPWPASRIWDLGTGDWGPEATGLPARRTLASVSLHLMAIDPQLLSIMVCPVSHAPLREIDDWLISTDPETRRRYPIRDGIPVMLIEESEEMAQDDWEEALK